mgnify:CR=1 FL=1
MTEADCISKPTIGTVAAEIEACSDSEFSCAIKRDEFNSMNTGRKRHSTCEIASVSGRDFRCGAYGIIAAQVSNLQNAGIPGCRRNKFSVPPRVCIGYFGINR